MSLLDEVRSVAIVHAHPDDETLATGALIVDLVERGVRVEVLTCTRGERGEVVPGSGAPAEGSPELIEHRLGELQRALAELGVDGPVFLGSGSARAAGLDERTYHDSGMRWVTPSLAGPDENAPDNAFSIVDVDEEAADIAAWLRAVDPEVVVTYNTIGGYGHPDHVRAREATEIATRELGLPLFEVIPPDRPEAEEPGIEWDDLSRHVDQVAAALGQHASQLTVRGTEIEHVGGQREQIATRMGLRQVQPAG